MIQTLIGRPLQRYDLAEFNNDKIFSLNRTNQGEFYEEKYSNSSSRGFPQLVACQKQIAEEIQETEGVDTEPLGSQGGEEDIEIPSKVALKSMLGFSRKGNVLSMNIASEDNTLSLAHRFSDETWGVFVNIK